jgi:antitoxin ParD1/3/4
MAAKHTLHVALTEPLARYVAEQVVSGEYATASEVVRTGLRLLIERNLARANGHHGRAPERKQEDPRCRKGKSSAPVDVAPGGRR